MSNYYNRTVAVAAMPRSKRRRKDRNGSSQITISYSGATSEINKQTVIDALGYTPANAGAGYLTEVTYNDVVAALGFIPASGVTTTGLQRPRLTVISGYEDPRYPAAMDPVLRVQHPLLGTVTGAEAVLMLWRKRRTKSLDKDPVGVGIYPQHRSGWGEARGESATNPALTFGARVTLDTLRLHILHNYVCVYGQALPSAMTLAQFHALTTANEPRFGRLASYTSTYSESFRKKTRGRELFGVAIRYPNPKFSAEIASDRTLAETTRMINGVPRYIYTDVAPLIVQITSSGSSGSSYEIGFDSSPRPR